MTPNPVECPQQQYTLSVNGRKKRSVTAADDLEVHRPYIFNPDTSIRPMTETWPTPSGITEAQANQICRDAATGANAHGLCHNLFGDDIYIGVAPCVDDIMVQYRTGCLILHLNGFVLHIVATKHSHVMTMHTAQHLLSTSLREKILGDTFEFKIQMLIPSDFFENKNMFFI